MSGSQPKRPTTKKTGRPPSLFFSEQDRARAREVGNRVTWKLEANHNILSFIDRKNFKIHQSNNKLSNQMPVILSTPNPYYQTVQQEDLARNCPIVIWLDDAPHLAAYNPLIHKIEGPSGYKLPTESDKIIHAKDFRLVPRFTTDKPANDQMDEYVSMRDNQWTTPLKFHHYWEGTFNFYYLETIEAKAPLLAGFMKDSSLIEIKRMFFIIMKRSYVSYYNFYLSSMQPGGGGGNNNPGPDDSRQSRKRKADEISLFDNDSSNHSQSSSQQQQQQQRKHSSSASATMDYLDMHDQMSEKLKEQMSQDERKIYKKIKSEMRRKMKEILSTTYLKVMENEYTEAKECFMKATTLVSQVVFSNGKTAIGIRRNASSNLLRASAASLPDLSSDGYGNYHQQQQGSRPSNMNESTEIGLLTHEFDSYSLPANTTSFGSGLLSMNNRRSNPFEYGDGDDSMEVGNDDDYGGSTPHSQSQSQRGTQPTDSVGDDVGTFSSQIKRKTARGNYSQDIITCTEIARRIVHSWVACYSIYDSKITQQYWKQLGVDNSPEAIKRRKRNASSILYKAGVIADSEDDILKRFKPLLPFPAVFYYATVSFIPETFKFTLKTPCWALQFVRLLNNNSNALIYLNGLRFDKFSELVSSYDRINQTLIRNILNFMNSDEVTTDLLHTSGQDICSKVTKLEAVGVLYTSMFDMTYRSQGEHNSSIINFLQSITAYSPIPTIESQHWSCALQAASTLNSHQIQCSNLQVDVYKKRVMNSMKYLPVKLYESPPWCVMKLSSTKTVPCNPKQTVYFYKDSEFAGRIAYNLRKTIRGIDDEEDQNNRKSIWVCQRDHFATWMRICEFVKETNITLFARHEEFLRCRTAVEQSVLMALIGQECLLEPSTNLGLLVYLPTLIEQQLFILLDRRDQSERQSRFILAWSAFTRAPYLRASAKTLEATIDGHPYFPNIYIPHAEAMTVNDWEVLMKVWKMDKNIRKKEKGVELDLGTSEIYAAASPVLGGISPSGRNEAQNYFMFTTYKRHLFRLADMDQFNVNAIINGSLVKYRLPSGWKGRPRQVKGGKSTQPVVAPVDLDKTYRTGTPEDETKFAKWFDTHINESVESRHLFQFCSDLLLLDYSKAQENDWEGSGSGRDEPGNKINGRPVRVISSEWTLISTPSDMPTDEQYVFVSDYTTSLNKEPDTNVIYHKLSSMDSSEYVRDSVTQKPIPLPLALIHMSVPNYQMIEFTELVPRETTIYLLKINPDKFMMICPMRLANILARSRQHTYCVSEKLWKAYLWKWSKYPEDNLLLQTLDGKYLIPVPLYAFCECEITEDDLVKVEEHEETAEDLPKSSELAPYQVLNPLPSPVDSDSEEDSDAEDFGRKERKDSFEYHSDEGEGEEEEEDGMAVSEALVPDRAMSNRPSLLVSTSSSSSLPLHTKRSDNEESPIDLGNGDGEDDDDLIIVHDERSQSSDVSSRFNNGRLKKVSSFTQPTSKNNSTNQPTSNRGQQQPSAPTNFKNLREQLHASSINM